MPKRTPKVRRVGSQEQRRRPSMYLSVKTDEKFTGYALFDPDPEIDLDDNPGWFEHMRHWNQRGGFYVPCVGPEDCSLCKQGSFPSNVALSLWQVTHMDGEELDEPTLKVFTMNGSVVTEFSELLAEEREDDEDASIIGRKFRVRRDSDGGDYSTREFRDDELSKKEIKSLLEDAPDLEEMVDKSLTQALERMESMGSLRDADDDEGDEEKGRSSKKKSDSKKKKKDEDDEDEDDKKKDKKKKKKKDEEDDPEPEDEQPEFEEESVTVISKRGDKIKVEHEEHGELALVAGDDVDLSDVSKGDEITITVSVEDDTLTLMEIHEEGGGGGEDFEAEGFELEDEEVTITKINSKEETLQVEHDDHGKFVLFFGTDVEIDFDDYEKGQEITISAIRDSDGDMVSGDAPEAKKKKKKK